eukprot:Tamp_03136.p1 GENE.Tamp_03136~~Tamp_03136.p1  ORF type:complete len:1171 (+),score=340.99 Tamp_03136:337-3513(+)
MVPLMAALARAIESRSGACNAQELANVAWAFAKAGHLDAELFSNLARAAEQCLDNFKPQELANTAWAFATAGHSDPQLFKALAQAVATRLDDFIMQGLANTAWAFAKAGYFDVLLFGAMAKVAEQRLGDCNAQDLANIAWAYAKLGQFDVQLFSALARSSEGQLDRFNAQGLANTVWAFAKAGHLDAKLFAAFSRAIEQRLGGFNAQDLANTAWAFAKACHVDARLFTGLAKSAEQCLDDFNAQDLVNTVWAFAKIGQLDADFFAAVSRAIKERRVEDLDAPQIANLAWAFAKANQLDKSLFTRLAQSVQERVADLSAQDLAKIAWAFANAGYLEDALFGGLARTAEQMVDELDEEDLDNTEWAFVKAGQQHMVKLLRKRRKRSNLAAASLASASVDVSKCGRIVVAGGGIGGAALAVALQNKGFDVLVLEADASFDARKQGYGLTIQSHAALNAMNINLAQDDAPSTSHYTFSAEGHILGFFGEAFGSKSRDRQESEDSGRFVHIPRQMLRQRILERIAPGAIRWNSKLKSFSCWSEGQGGPQKKKGKGKQKSGGAQNGVTVTLTDGTTMDAALLVGCDGIFSTVRRLLQLPGDRLNYVGLVVVLGIVDQVPLTERRIFETVDGSARIYAMPFTTTQAMWQLSFPCSEEAARVFSKDTAALKAEILGLCADWHHPIPALLANTRLDCMSGYPVYDREALEPAVLRPPHPAPATPTASEQASAQRRVTLMGDAAHPMTPFKAQGANQALSDAVLLADTLVECISKHGAEAGLDAALPLFEQKMLNRSSRVVVGSRSKAKEMHSSLALQPARKAQREADGVDMQKAIAVLRAKRIGAASACDARGLDAVVAEALGMPSAGKSQGKRSKLGEDYAGSKKTFDHSDDEHQQSSTAQLTEEECERRKREEKKAKKVQRQKRRKAEKRALKDSGPEGEDAVAQRTDTPATEAKAQKQQQKQQQQQHSGAGAARKDKKRKRQRDVDAREEGKQDAVGSRDGSEASDAASLVPTRLWGFYDDDWRKCVLLKVKNSGKHKVEWPDGSTSVLQPDCIQPRGKKTRNS